MTRIKLFEELNRFGSAPAGIQGASPALHPTTGGYYPGELSQEPSALHVVTRLKHFCDQHWTHIGHDDPLLGKDPENEENGLAGRTCLGVHLPMFLNFSEIRH